jgi:hypothetical protein
MSLAPQPNGFVVLHFFSLKSVLNKCTICLCRKFDFHAGRKGQGAGGGGDSLKETMQNFWRIFCYRDSCVSFF